MNADIKVSVCVVTYNQEKYISECLQSLIDQKTDFLFEIIVGEDCSTDNTRGIVDEFAKKYPTIIVRNYHDKNVGAVQNAITSYRMARGEYICHMDGDDGALPGKLQETVAFLDVHPECVMVTHDAAVIDTHSEKVRNSLKKFDSGIYGIEDLVRNLPFFTSSAKMVRKRACIDSLPGLNNNAVDVELHLLEARFGNIAHINKPLGYYREMVGVSSLGKRVNPLIVKGYSRIFDGLLSGGLGVVKIGSSELKKLHSRALLNFAYQSIYMGQLDDARGYCIDSVRVSFFSYKQVLMFFLTFGGFLSSWLFRLRYAMKNKVDKV